MEQDRIGIATTTYPLRSTGRVAKEANRHRVAGLNIPLPTAHICTGYTNWVLAVIRIQGGQLRFILFLGMIAVLLPIGCGGTNAGQTASGQTTLSMTRCSSTFGPIPGDVNPADAGIVDNCLPGGRCEFVTAGPGAGGCQPNPDGGFTCNSGGPSWTCVYEGGDSGSGH
jgi:hypothetical protein